MEHLLVYLLILLTVGVIAILPSLIVGPSRRTERSIETVDLSDPFDQTVSVPSAQSVLAEVD